MIFLDEKMNPIGSSSNATAYLNEQTKRYGLKESMFNRFKHDAGGMEICFESEVAWNELTHRMAVAEFKSLQESQCLNEGFWDTIVGWAKKVKEFFVKIWNAIKAWIKNMWQKLTGTTDKDLIKKVQDVASYGENVDVEMYFDPSKFESEANKAIKIAEEARDTAWKKAQEAINVQPKNKQDAETFRNKLDEECEKAKTEADEAYDDFANKETDSKELGSNEIVAGLTDYDKHVKKLVKFLNDEDKVFKVGMKLADKAVKDANTAKDKKQKEINKKDSTAKTDYDLIEKQLICDATVKAAGYCRRLIQDGLKMANLVKSRLDHDHDACRSAAKEFIKTALKNKKERES